MWASEMTMNSTEVTRVPIYLHVGKSEKVKNLFWHSRIQCERERLKYYYCGIVRPVLYAHVGG